MEISTPSICYEFDDIREVEFYQTLNQLGRLDCSYLSYALEEASGKRVHFFSDMQWLNVYMSENFISTCQLTTLCRTAGNIVIPWNTIKPSNMEQKKVWDARTDYDIANGLTIAHKLDESYEMVAFGTRKSNTQFLDVLQQNKSFLQLCLLQLRKTARKNLSLVSS